jgi:cytochrome c oxidase subunit 1
MSNDMTKGVQEVGVAYDVHTNGNGDGHDHHHHKETFISKYIFSQDHKTIAKQFLITGIIWAIIGALFSVLFRLQLGYPTKLSRSWKPFSASGRKVVAFQPTFIMP